MEKVESFTAEAAKIQKPFNSASKKPRVSTGDIGGREGAACEQGSKRPSFQVRSGNSLIQGKPKNANNKFAHAYVDP